MKFAADSNIIVEIVMPSESECNKTLEEGHSYTNTNEYEERERNIHYEI